MDQSYTAKFLNTREVAKLLKVNEKMVYALVNDKGLPATKVTGKWMFLRSLVEEWLEANIINLPQAATAKPSDSGRLLLAGSDDLLFARTLNLFHKNSTTITPFFANLGSMGGLTCLRRGLCHIGVCHLLQDDDREYNFEFAEKELDRLPVFVNFSKRHQGILVAKGNPKNITTIADLAKPGVRIVNRPLGTGTRLLLDYEIAKSSISSSSIVGYHQELARHLDVGLAVLSGQADAGPAIRPVAGLLDLDFLPLRWERFDLLVAREHFFDKAVQQFLGLLHDAEFRKLADSFLGYDLSLCGTMIFPENLNKGE